MNKFISFLILISAFTLLGCSRANLAAVGAWGCDHKVTLFSGGKVVGVWHTTGKVENEEHSDGYYFQDKATGKFITLSGEVLIEQE